MGNFKILLALQFFEIADDLNRELQVGEVLFIEAKKLRRKRKYLDLPDNFLACDAKFRAKYSTYVPKLYAVVNVKAEDYKCARRLAVRKIRHALWIVTAFQLGSSNRYNRRNIFYHALDASQLTYIIDEKANIRGGEKWCHQQTFLLEKKKLQNYFALDFLKLPPSLSLQQSVQKALVCIGKSYVSRDLDDAFLYAFIAIETLLKKKNEKRWVQTSHIIAGRVEALFCWILDVDYNKDMFEKIYKKRNQMVHDGVTGIVDVPDIEHIDRVLLNLLMVLCHFPKRFASKEMIVEFTAKYAAYQTLGKKVPKRYHNKMVFVDHNYRGAYEKLEEYYDQFIA